MARSEMTHDEKFQAIQALGEAVLKMRRPGEWYVYQAVELKRAGSAMLRGVPGEGSTPGSAICDYWTQLTHLPPGDRLVINAMDSVTRREVRWGGFMWEDVP